MACRISELILDCADPERLASFWSAVLGFEEIGRERDSVAIGPPGVGFGGPQPILILSRSDDPRPAKLPLHIDVSPTDTDQDTELAPVVGSRRAAGRRRPDRRGVLARARRPGRQRVLPAADQSRPGLAAHAARGSSR